MGNCLSGTGAAREQEGNNPASGPAPGPLPTASKEVAELDNIPLKVVEQATQSFNPKVKVEEDELNVVFHAEMAIEGRPVELVVIKRLKRISTEEYTLWESTVYSELKNVNSVGLSPILGKSLDNNHPILIYPHYANNTLHSSMATGANAFVTSELTWRQRLRIALDVAEGLLYLHNLQIIHRDLTASHVYLDENYRAYIGDYGLAVRGPGKNQVHVSQGTVVGSEDYIDPVYYVTGRLTFFSDVYSFGILLLVLISGSSRADRNEMSPVAKFEKKNMHVLMDSQLGGHEEEVRKVADLAGLCLNKTAKQRPSTRVLVEELTPLMAQADAQA